MARHRTMLEMIYQRHLQVSKDKILTIAVRVEEPMEAEDRTEDQGEREPGKVKEVDEDELPEYNSSSNEDEAEETVAQELYRSSTFLIEACTQYGRQV